MHYIPKYFIASQSEVIHTDMRIPYGLFTEARRCHEGNIIEDNLSGGCQKSYLVATRREELSGSLIFAINKGGTQLHGINFFWPLWIFNLYRCFCQRPESDLFFFSQSILQFAFCISVCLVLLGKSELQRLPVSHIEEDLSCCICKSLFKSERSIWLVSGSTYIWSGRCLQET